MTKNSNFYETPKFLHVIHANKRFFIMHNRKCKKLVLASIKFEKSDISEENNIVELFLTAINILALTSEEKFGLMPITEYLTF